MSEWVVPCNLKFFDIIDWFDDGNALVYWKKDASMTIGDKVYLYLGNPISKICYLCEVIDDNVDRELINSNPYAIKNNCSQRQKYMCLKLIKNLEDKNLHFKVLKEHGLGQVQRQAGVDRKLKIYLDSKIQEE